MVDILRQCGNCRYFRQHYVKRGLSFKTTMCGHCVYKNITQSKMSIHVLKNACLNWQLNEDNSDMLEVHFTNILDDVYNKLDKIISYFQDKN